MNKVIFALLALMAIVGFYFYPQLPAYLPTHWNIQGEVDGTMRKQIAIWLLPGMSAVMVILFKVLPHFDPKKDKYQLFKKEWEIIQTALVGLFSYLYGVTIYQALNPEKPFLPLMFTGLGAFFIILGNYMSKIRQNYFIGIRVPWTLSDEENWNKTHRYASWCFVIAGIMTLVQAYLPWNAPVVIFGGIFLSAGLPCIYSFLLYKKALRLMKWVYVGLGVVLAGVVAVRTATPEDSWVCENGGWVQHGHPAVPMPTQACK